MDSVTLGGIVTLAAGIVWYSIQSRTQAQASGASIVQPILKNQEEPPVSVPPGIDEVQAFRGLKAYHDFTRQKGATQAERVAMFGTAIKWLLVDPVDGGDSEVITNEA